MTSGKQSFVVLALTLSTTVGIRTALATCPPPPSGYTCKCDDDASPTKWVCAKWDNVELPNEGFDFVVDYSPGDPEVQFVTANEGWEVYSETLDAQGNPTGPADLGDVLLAGDVSPNDGNFAVAITKAANVGSINLKSSDVDWTGGSTLGLSDTITFISGDVAEILVVKDGSGNRGTVEGTVLIFGQLPGDLTIPHIGGSVTISGTLGNAYLETLESGGLLEVQAGIQGGAHDISVTDNLAGKLTLKGVLSHGVTITIADFEGSGKLDLQEDSYATINLENGIDSADALAKIAYHYGTMDLHNKDVNGVLNILAFYDSAYIINGGAVNGVVKVGNHILEQFALIEGTMTFASVAAGGEIVASSPAPAMKGAIHIEGAVDGLIKLEVDLQERAAGTGTGLIDIAGDLGGTVECLADVTNTGQITIGEDMMGTSKITVDGACDGDISVGESTTANTLIHCKSSLGSSGSITINSSQGAHDVAGDITVGSSSGDPVMGDYDGCFVILDDGAGNGGNFRGVLRMPFVTTRRRQIPISITESALLAMSTGRSTS